MVAQTEPRTKNLKEPDNFGKTRTKPEPEPKNPEPETLTLNPNR